MKYRLKNDFNFKSEAGEYGVRSYEFDYAVNSSHGSWSRIGKMLEALSENLSDEDYHELCHQLHGNKAEFDAVDGEYRDGSAPMSKKKFETVKASLYRGIFWSTLGTLDDLDLEEEREGEENDDF